MALTITDECINCDVCEPECPNEAISQARKITKSTPTKNRMRQYYDEPQCVQVCPEDCIPMIPTMSKTKTCYGSSTKADGQQAPLICRWHQKNFAPGAGFLRRPLLCVHVAQNECNQRLAFFA